MTTTTANKKVKQTEKKEFSQQEKNKIIEKLTTARIGLLLRHPFFGNLATRLKISRCHRLVQHTGHRWSLFLL